MQTKLPPVLLALVTVAGCATTPEASFDEFEASKADSAGASSPVKLRYANATGDDMNVVVDVADVPGQTGPKDVVVHYKDRDGKWRDQPTELLRDEGGHELRFATGVPHRSPETCNDGHCTPDPFRGEFAIRYKVGAKTYWDNNGKRNYVADAVGPGVDLAIIEMGAGFFQGAGDMMFVDLLVRDIVRDKVVTLSYTTDQDTQLRKATGEYVFGKDGGEHWRAFVGLNNGETRVKFTAAVTQGSRQASNDNFGKSFKCRLEEPGPNDSGWRCSGDEALEFDPDAGPEGAWQPTQEF